MSNVFQGQPPPIFEQALVDLATGRATRSFYLFLQDLWNLTQQAQTTQDPQLIGLFLAAAKQASAPSPGPLPSSSDNFVSMLLYAARAAASGIRITANTHANKASYPATPAGSLYFETDRTAFYIAEAGVWKWATGVYYDVFANQPGDLGTNDVGFLFSATDSLDYRWTGAAWTTLLTVKAAPAVNPTRVTLDEGASPLYSQLLAQANLLGALALFCGAADDSSLLFDATWESVAAVATLVAANATLALITKTGAKLLFQYASGQTVGNAVTGLATAIALDLANGRAGFGGNTTPGYPVDVTGDINTSTRFRAGGTAGLTQVITLAKITGGGSNGSATFTGGILTAYSAPT